jgi:arylsulfatase
VSDRKPNFLFFFPDQQRPDWLGFNSELDIHTPVLDRLAERGVRFTEAVTPSPLCAPARACLASGRSYENCRVPDNHSDYPLDMPTYYQVLRDAGYRVAGVGKFDLHKDTSDPANLDWHLDGSRLLDEWGFTEGIDNEGKIDGSSSYRSTGGPRGPYLKFLADRGLAEAYVQEHAEQRKKLGAYTTALPDDAYCDNWIAENGKSFIRGFPIDTPWHLVVNFTGPHGPMDVTERMRKTVEDRTYPPPLENDTHSPDDLLRNRQNYVAMIENIDRLMGEMIEEVEKRGELDNTIIIYSSDHGEMLGDFGRFGKNIWRFASAHIPLVISGLGMTEGKETEALVDLTDVTATILDYSGCGSLPEMHGQSLRPVLEEKCDTHREVVVSGLQPWMMVYDGRYKLVEEDGQAPRLFDRNEDPMEMKDIAEENPDILERLRRRL